MITKELGLEDSQHSLSFQSRLGRKEWLDPYTIDKVQELCSRGVKKLWVVAPSFVSDCLETLDELGNELRKDFLMAGGEEFHLIPALNSEPDWVQALGHIVRDGQENWPRA